MDVVEFLEWQSGELEVQRKEQEVQRKEQEAQRKERVAQRKERVAEQRSIHEQDVSTVVDEVFGDTFASLCGQDCGAEITVDRFYVLRDGDLFTACCSKCFRAGVKSGLAGKKRIAEKMRRLVWNKYNGKRVEGQCFHCGEGGRKIHFYLDSWHLGHDLADSNGGDRVEDNLAPLHPRCNWDQGTRSFEEYGMGV